MPIENVSFAEKVDLKLHLLDRLIRIKELEGSMPLGRVVEERSLVLIKSIGKDLGIFEPETVDAGSITVNITAETTPGFELIVKETEEFASAVSKKIEEALENVSVRIASAENE